jgi:hypothetical protein
LTELVLTQINTRFYSICENKNLVIQARGLPFDDQDEIVLGYRTTIKGVIPLI